MPGREWMDLVIRYLDQVLGLAREDHAAALVECIVKRSDADRISCCDPLIVLAVVDDACEFGIEFLEHFGSVFFIHRKKNFTVAVALKGISLCLQFIPEGSEAVYLAVTDHGIIIKFKRLHPFGGEPHDR